jgi:phosphoserine phosphatase RsbU/P
MDPLLENAPCGYLSFNDNGIILRVNRTLALLVQYEPEELVGRSIETILNIAGRIFYQTHFFPLLKLHGKAEEIFISLNARNGDLVPVITNSVREEEDGKYVCNCVFIPVFQRRKYEDEILAAKKQAEKALYENAELMKTKEQLAVHAEILDKQVRQLNRVSDEVLQFNSIIAHDMQECVRKVLLFVQLAEDKNDRSYLDKVLQSAYRLRRIIENLDLFVSLGLDKSEFVQVDLNQIIRDARDKVIRELEFNALHVNCPPLPPIYGAEYQLRILFYHLFENSVKFRNGDKAEVGISHSVFEENLYKNSTDKYRYIEVLKIKIRDKGKGFNNKYNDYVFNMFKKLDAGSADLGFGLALCKKIVDNHAGEIEIDSKPAEGTSVTITLPVYAGLQVKRAQLAGE